MKEELEEQLVSDFPNVFRLEDIKGQPYDMFGIEFGDGWESSLRLAASKLELLLIEAIKKDPEGYSFGYYRTSQLKEKYGTGRWYLSGGTDEMFKITDAWQQQTKTICETCGKEGKLRGKFWYYTACFEHAKLEDKDNLELLENKYDESVNKNL